MAQNTLPSGICDLMQMAENVACGLETHGHWLKITQVPAAEFRGIVDALRQNETAFSSVRSEKATAGKWMNAADAALTGWLAKARLAVMLARGTQWSEAWVEAGFTHRRTNVPKATASRTELARRLVDFFSRYPHLGVAHANVTRLMDGDSMMMRSRPDKPIGSSQVHGMRGRGCATRLSGPCGVRCAA